MTETERFEEIITKLQQAYEESYSKPCSRQNIYWDAIRYDLYGVTPCYAEGKM